jgi:hypothetical protein
VELLVSPKGFFVPFNDACCPQAYAAACRGTTTLIGWKCTIDRCASIENYLRSLPAVTRSMLCTPSWHSRLQKWYIILRACQTASQHGSMR